MNTDEQRHAARTPSGAIWPLGIVALLAMNMTIVGITVYYATTDPSVAVEPNYYEKAVKWDRTAEINARSARLGWTAQVAVPGRASATPQPMTVTLKDASGQPVRGAQVSVVAFHNARSGDRQTVMLEPSAPGVYAGTFTAARHGQWHFEISAHRESDEFAKQLDQDVRDGSVPGGAR